MKFPPVRASLGSLVPILALLAACAPAPSPASSIDQASTQVAPADAPSPGAGLAFRLSESQDPARPYFHDFGVVPEGAILHHTFVLENRDPRRVEIQKIDPACGCTVARLAKELPDGTLEAALTDQPGRLLVLEPGEAMHVALEVDTDEVRTKNVPKLFMVRVSSDSVTTPFVTLECHLVVREHFQVSPATLDLRTLPAGGSGEGVITIKSMAPDYHMLGDLGPLPEGVTAELARSPIVGDDLNVWTLKAGFLPPLEPGPKSAELRVHTLDQNGEPAEDLVIMMTANVTQAINVYPGRLILRPGPKGQPTQVLAELVAHLPGQRLNVLGFTIEGEQSEALSFSAEPYQPASDGTSQRWNLALGVQQPPSVPSFTGTVILELDSPSTPRYEIPYVGLGF